MAVYWVCDRCAPAILNADVSGLEYAEQDVLLAWVEQTGYTVDAGRVPQPGYWDCAACEDTQCGGSAQALETLP
jgi:hypothetical protein